MKTISRPTLRYYGSQFRNAKWIVSHMPQQHHYDQVTIPFAGGLSVLLNMEPAKLETANDLNGRVINFFKQLRDRPQELILAIRLTPWHEGEYDLSHTIAADPLEDARRFWCECWMSIQGGGVSSKSGFRIVKSIRSRWTTAAKDGVDIEHLYVAAERLKKIQFVQRDAIQLIKSFLAKKHYRKTLFYCDPPYPKGTRGTANAYQFETSPQLHQDLAHALLSKDGVLAVVSGKPNEMYANLFESEGFERVDKKTRENSGSDSTHSIWLSPAVQYAKKAKRLL